VKRVGLQDMSATELVDGFAAAALGQFQAELQSNIAKQNKFVEQAMAIAAELKSRPGDQRSALLGLYEHPNVQVRLNAARLTLAVAPATARQVVETIAASRKYPQAMDAGMCLWALEQGIFKPE
jgi:predicted short-subunit dehydrogenase-like oxidoreductase (DUF2520 family)